jgi:hypothetical protein
MKQEPQPFYAQCRIACGRRAKIDVYVRRIRYRHPFGRYVFLAEGWRALVSEACERERRATMQRGTERAEHRLGAIVHCPVQISEIGPQPIGPDMVGVNGLPGFGSTELALARLPSRRPSTTRAF